MSYASPQQPSLSDCLAHAVVEDCQGWLGVSSTLAVQTCLSGVRDRAFLLDPSLPCWKIWGPLDDPAFWRPLVARTGHPTLSIKWATALEMLYFSSEDALAELLRLMRDYPLAQSLLGIRTVREACTLDDENDFGIGRFWAALRERPGAFLGSACGRALHHYLIGLDRGGDWLGLPTLPGLRHVLDTIESQSEDCYGSKFAAYRIYEHEGAAELLGWALDGHPNFPVLADDERPQA